MIQFIKTTIFYTGLFSIIYYVLSMLTGCSGSTFTTTYQYDLICTFGNTNQIEINDVEVHFFLISDRNTYKVTKGKATFYFPKNHCILSKVKRSDV